jgi:5'-deoxynucleotidase YfbR-like HD superfamily hydrolase
MSEWIQKAFAAHVVMTQISAVREAGAVKRCHVVPHTGHYDVAQHCYGVVSLLMLLHPKPSNNLIMASLWHDTAERWLGDMPTTAKWYDDVLGRVYNATEDKLMKNIGLANELTNEEVNWLKTVDLLELYLWCREQEFMGNRNVVQMRKTCLDALEGFAVDGTMPEQAVMVLDHLRQQSHTRLSDEFNEVIHGLEKAGTGLGN